MTLAPVGRAACGEQEDQERPGGQERAERHPLPGPDGASRQQRGPGGGEQQQHGDESAGQFHVPAAGAVPAAGRGSRPASSAVIAASQSIAAVAVPWRMKHPKSHRPVQASWAMIGPVPLRARRGRQRRRGSAAWSGVLVMRLHCCVRGLAFRLP
jgi:hypothetical protein